MVDAQKRECAFLIRPDSACAVFGKNLRLDAVRRDRLCPAGDLRIRFRYIATPPSLL